MPSRRRILKTAGGGLALGGTLNALPALAADELALDPALPDGTRAEAVLDRLPGKVPLVKLSWRPPNYETPLSYFDRLYTPNNAFFVRYHLADIPEIDAAAWRLRIGGAAATKPLEFGIEQLRSDFEPIEITAVCQCSGNRRGLVRPHVPGVQWGYGAMGNARWRGVRLKDLLAAAGVGEDAVEVVFDAADGPLLEETPDFVKSLPAWKAREDEPLVAYEMNGRPLPHFNGFPARLVVPGWTATYWVKHLTSIEAVREPFTGYWMKTAYRIPVGRFPVVETFASQETATTTPIGEMVVNSVITNLTEGERLRVGEPFEMRGVAWDAGYGIREVLVSTDGGASWGEAVLGEDPGRFSFRPWSFRFAPGQAGRHVVTASAVNGIGQTQTTAPIPNPSGYHHNVMHRITIDAA